MKPSNVNPPFLLPLDGEPVRCHFYAFGEKGSLDECEQDATTEVSVGVVRLFSNWLEHNRRAIIGLRPGTCYLCDTHDRIITEVIREAI
jgi:hypothetical protein